MRPPDVIGRAALSVLTLPFLELGLAAGPAAPAGQHLCYLASEPAAGLTATRLCFDEANKAVDLDGRTCRIIGRRVQHPHRDYLDLLCGEERVDLDINRLPDGRLLVNRRPLGEAYFYRPETPASGPRP